VVQTTGQPVKNFKPRQGVGSNVTFDDLSDGGIPRIAESLYRRPRKKRVAKILQKGTKETKTAIQDPSLIFVSFC
jgi:hypothetical protein